MNNPLSKYDVVWEFPKYGVFMHRYSSNGEWRTYGQLDESFFLLVVPNIFLSGEEDLRKYFEGSPFPLNKLLLSQPKKCNAVLVERTVVEAIFKQVDDPEMFDEFSLQTVINSEVVDEATLKRIKKVAIRDNDPIMFNSEFWNEKKPTRITF